jgi:uncharacterized membrane protein
MGFISWMFRGWYRDLSVWGIILGFVSFNSFILGASVTTAYTIGIVALALIFVDLITTVVRWQYRLYVMERDRVVNELERK